MFLKFLRQKRNQGSALIMVITIVAFISVLGTTLLYMSGANYQMKQSDFKTKRVFYLDEEFFESIRSAVIADASVAAEKSFDDVIPVYAKYSNVSSAYSIGGAPGGGLSDAEKAQLKKDLDLFQQEYNKSFRANFETEWKKHFKDALNNVSYQTGIVNLFGSGVDESTLTEINKGYYQFDYNERDASGNIINTLNVTISFMSDASIGAGSPEEITEYENNPISVYSKNYDCILPIKIIVKNSDGYTASIISSIAVTPPTIDTSFATSGSFFEKSISEYVYYTNWTKL